MRMIQKPLIGLTTTRMPNPSRHLAFGINEPYVKSIVEAGGIPILIPPELSPDDLDRLLDRLDGILFTGGYDIDPRQYGGQPHPKVERIDAQRDRLEVDLSRKLVHSTKPFLGICRGCQVINVSLGGTLYEHLPEQLPGAISHDNHDRPRDYLAHPVTVKPGSRLANILEGSQVSVNSLHHQGVWHLASQLRATAFASDGLVEAFELPGHPFALAVQWHPEELQQNQAMRNLFQAFVQACQVAELLDPAREDL